MTAGKKKMILFIWLLISIAVLGSVLLGALDYYDSLKTETVESILLQDNKSFAGMQQMYLDQYLDNIKKTVAYLGINILMTIFAIWSIKS